MITKQLYLLGKETKTHSPLYKPYAAAYYIPQKKFLLHQTFLSAQSYTAHREEQNLFPSNVSAKPQVPLWMLAKLSRTYFHQRMHHEM